MRKYGLIGYPLGHSFSKKYFTGKFAAEHISDCSYDNYALSSIDEFPSLVASDDEFCGFNVTIPYKSEILRYADHSDDMVKNIGAANVVRIKRAGGKSKIYAYNSDVTGIRESLKDFFTMGKWNALVLGTGGASKAVTWTLKDMGFSVLTVSRSKGLGNLCYDELGPELIDRTDLIVNTTPLGMFPDTLSKPELDYSLLGSRHTLFDLVYNPELTAFLIMGKERGCRIITGLKMLYAQAERSWAIWNDPSF